jgi:alkylated DNA repair dioxygenase AlkB
MPQLSLFEPAGSVLPDDEFGSFVYTPDWLPRLFADAWFDELRQTIGWQAQRRVMYDRELDVPRLTAHFDLAAGEPVPALLRDAGLRVSAAVGTVFNSVGLNRYRDGNDSVAPHNDHLDELERGAPIALVSLGATRRMTLRRKGPKHRAFHADLAAGSLLVMSYDTQLHYTHGIPKTTEAVGERISLAFRVKGPGDPGKQAARRRQYR